MEGTKLDKILEYLPNWQKIKKRKHQAQPSQISIYFCVLCFIKFTLWFICNKLWWIMSTCNTNLCVLKKSLSPHSEGLDKNKSPLIWKSPQWSKYKWRSLKQHWTESSSNEALTSTLKYSSPVETSQPILFKPAKMPCKHISEHVVVFGQLPPGWIAREIPTGRHVCASNSSPRGHCQPQLTRQRTAEVWSCRRLNAWPIGLGGSPSVQDQI